MEFNQKLFTCLFVSAVFLFTFFIVKDNIKEFLSQYLFGKSIYTDFNIIYQYIYNKYLNLGDKEEIYNIKSIVNSNIIISNSKKNNTLDTIVIFICTTFISVTVAFANINVQGFKDKTDINELISITRNNVIDNFITILLLIGIIYTVKMFFNIIEQVKLEYYLLVQNIINEIEKIEKEDSEKKYNNILNAKKNEKLSSKDKKKRIADLEGKIKIIDYKYNFIFTWSLVVMVIIFVACTIVLQKVQSLISNSNIVINIVFYSTCLIIFGCILFVYYKYLKSKQEKIYEYKRTLRESYLENEDICIEIRVLKDLLAEEDKFIYKEKSKKSNKKI